MRSIILGMLMAAGATIACAQDIGGRYDVRGKNVNGSEYGGIAEITVTSENTCRIVWEVGSISRGICMRNQNAFTAAYDLGGKIGLIIYEIMPDGSMQGLWTIADQPGLGVENLYPLR